MKIPGPVRPQKSSTSVPGARTEEWLSPRMVCIAARNWLAGF